MQLWTQVKAFLAPIKVDYAVCGGGAIDLFLNRHTRMHKDLDVAVYWQDRDAIVRHMLKLGWQIYEPCGGGRLHKIAAVDRQKGIKSNIWCVKPSNPHYAFVEYEKGMFTATFDGAEQTQLDFIEFLFNHQAEGYFQYARNQQVKRRLTQAVLGIGHIPYLAPELVLLYKSTAANHPDYQLDFENAVPHMNEEQVHWLQTALLSSFPQGHVWLEALAER